MVNLVDENKSPLWKFDEEKPISKYTHIRKIACKLTVVVINRRLIRRIQTAMKNEKQPQNSVQLLKIYIHYTEIIEKSKLYHISCWFFLVYLDGGTPK